MDHRQALLEKLKSFDFERQEQPLPVVSLEDFFVGNDDLGSIGCNLNEHPGLPFFFETLKEIRSRPDVQDVLVEINDIDNLEVPDDDMWAFSDRIYIITSAARDDVARWTAPLMPDEVEEGWAYGGRPALSPQIANGQRVYAAWWD